MKLQILLNNYNFSLEDLKKFYGREDFNLKKVEESFNCNICASGEILNIDINDDNVEMVKKTINHMIDIILKKQDLDEITMQQIINRIKNNQEELADNIIFVTTYNGKIIRPKTNSQIKYFNLLEKNSIVFAMGAAGTGKTYLAVAYGIKLLKSKKINKIIVTRPIVEAGENLGFLPGELKEKVDPYLIPIYDAFNDIVGKETLEKYLDKGIVEIAPLAYMRGRTLNDALIILDEAQNTTTTQMKMFLTRLGYNAKMIITGDESQIDLKSSIKSGIIQAMEILNDIDDIAFLHFESHDVVRHPLVSKIITAYEKAEINLKKTNN